MPTHEVINVPGEETNGSVVSYERISGSSDKEI